MSSCRTKITWYDGANGGQLLNKLTSYVAQNVYCTCPRSNTHQRFRLSVNNDVLLVASSTQAQAHRRDCCVFSVWARLFRKLSTSVPVTGRSETRDCATWGKSKCFVSTSPMKAGFGGEMVVNSSSFQSHTTSFEDFIRVNKTCLWIRARQVKRITLLTKINF